MMGTLYYYEVKKILCQKVLWVAVLLMTLVLIGSGLADVIAGKSTDSESCKRFSGRMIDDALLEEVQEAPNSEDFIVFRNFITFCMGGSEHGLVDAEQVYNARKETSEKQMTQELLTEKEKEYWHKKESEVKKPFTYYYEEGFAGIYSSIYAANFMLLLLTAIAVCGLFSDERLNCTDQIIYSSVKKEMLFTVKILAGLSTGELLALYLFALLSGCSFGIYGVSGFNTPIQLRIPGCMLNITIGESFLYLFMLFMIAGIIYAAFSMLLSQVLGSRSAATAIMVMGLFLSMVNVPEKLGGISKIWSYLPGAYIGSWTFTEYRLISVCGRYFNNLQAAPVLWLIASALFFIATKIAYQRYQVQGR